MKHAKKVSSIAVLLGFIGASSGVAASAYSAFSENSTSQQHETCTGVVRDQSGETVIGASVVVKGTTNGTITGIDGDFSIANVKKGDILEISFVGYKTQEIVWNGQTLNVTLVDDTQQLEEVVVVAFGTQKKVNVTGAVSSVSAKELSARPVNSVTDALQGVVPGMNFSTGDAGGALTGKLISIFVVQVLSELALLFSRWC